MRVICFITILYYDFWFANEVSTRVIAEWKRTCSKVLHAGAQQMKRTIMYSISYASFHTLTTQTQ